MGSKCFVICDSEQHYANNLASFLANKIEFQIHVCSSVKQVEMLGDEKEIEILLIEDSYPGEERDRLHAANKILLVREQTGGEERSIYKYQPVDAILAELLALCIEENQSMILRQKIYRESCLIGVYSPIHRIGKTAFAIALGKYLAENTSVLYLNLEEYSGWNGRFGKNEKYTLADLLYYARQETGNLGVRIGVMAGHMDKLQYIAPIPISEDLKAVTYEEWQELLEQLVNQKLYKNIVIDFGESVQGLWKLLELCQKIYMPVDGAAESVAKITQFEKNAEVLGYQNLLRKITKIELKGSMDKYVKQLLSREERIKNDTGRTASREDFAETGSDGGY